MRFASGLAITTLCLRTFGAELWGAAAIALAVVDLLAVLDLAVPELCIYEAAKIASPDALARQLGQALWLLIPPVVFGSTILWLGADAAGRFVFRAQHSHASTLSAFFLASACGYPFLLLANAYSGALQGLGRLREMNATHAAASIMELVLVIGAMQAGRTLVEIQWLRSGAHIARCALFALSFSRLGLRVPWLKRPHARELRELAGYCLRFSLMKTLGSALQRANVPLAQAFTPTAMLGAYDAIDRLGGVLHRAANPVWDTIFHRLVRAFGTSAEPDKRVAGQRDFMAGTSILVALSACFTLTVVNLAPWIFPIWLGSELARDPIAFAPWVLVTWSLNLTTSMCTAVLSAHARFAVCSWVHACALGVNIAAIVILGAHDGRLALLAGPLIGNIALALGLALAGCRAANVPVRMFASRVFGIWAPAAGALAARAFLPSALHGFVATLALSALGCFGSLAMLRMGADFRELAREFRTPAGASRPPAF